jgi:alpha-1,2-glucosyltransferase
LVSYPYIKLLPNNKCSTQELRSINILFLILTFYYLNKIFQLSNDGIHDDLSELKSLKLCFFPLFYFFVFMYYTDVGSTLFILLGYYFSLTKSYYKSSIVFIFIIIYSFALYQYYFDRPILYGHFG